MPRLTHASPDSAEVRAGKLIPYRTTADIIDWSVPGKSIFERSRPLADATLRRITLGIERYVLCGNPFIAPVSSTVQVPAAATLIQTGFGERKGQTPRALDIHKPLGTIVAGGYKHALVLSICNYSAYQAKAGSFPLNNNVIAS